MANNRETVASYWLDKRRKLTITRYQFRKNTTVKYWIEIENTLTNSLFKLPGLTKDDLKNINELIEAIETSLEW